MSETALSNLIQIAITAIVTIALAAIAAWKTAKLGAHSGATEAMEPVQAQLTANSDKLDSIHTQTNSQLEEYRELIRKEAVNAIMAAVKEGIAQGIELERQRREGIDKKN